MPDKKEPAHIVLGASGQVGSAVADALLRNGHRVKAVIRNPDKARPLESRQRCSFFERVSEIGQKDGFQSLL